MALWLPVSGSGLGGEPEAETSSRWMVALWPPLHVPAGRLWEVLGKRWAPEHPVIFLRLGLQGAIVAMPAEWLRKGQLLCWTSSQEGSWNRLASLTSPCSQKLWGLNETHLGKIGLDHVTPGERRWNLEVELELSSMGCGPTQPTPVSHHGAQPWGGRDGLGSRCVVR